jgi:hypothetical protein
VCRADRAAHKILAALADPESTMMRAGAKRTTPPQDPGQTADLGSTLMRAGLKQTVPSQDLAPGQVGQQSALG